MSSVAIQTMTNGESGHGAAGSVFMETIEMRDGAPDAARTDYSSDAHAATTAASDASADASAASSRGNLRGKEPRALLRLGLCFWQVLQS